MAVHMRLFKTPQACGCTFVDIGRCGSTALSVSSPPNAGGKTIVWACRDEGGSFCIITPAGMAGRVGIE